MKVLLMVGLLMYRRKSCAPLFSVSVLGFPSYLKTSMSPLLKTPYYFQLRSVPILSTPVPPTSATWQGLDRYPLYYQLNPCKERPASRTTTVALEFIQWPLYHGLVCDHIQIDFAMIRRCGSYSYITFRATFKQKLFRLSSWSLIGGHRDCCLEFLRVTRPVHLPT